MTLQDEKAEFDVENFVPASYVDSGFNLDLKGLDIRDPKAKKVGKILAQEKNFGIALVDLSKLPDGQEFNIDGFRTYLWQPAWLERALTIEDKEFLDDLSDGEI
jgi:hypothetical protein